MQPALLLSPLWIQQFHMLFNCFLHVIQHLGGRFIDDGMFSDLEGYAVCARICGFVTNADTFELMPRRHIHPPFAYPETVLKQLTRGLGSGRFTLVTFVVTIWRPFQRRS